MRTLMFSVGLILCASSVFIGCLPDGGDEAASPGAVSVQATQGQLVDRIKQMSASPETYGDSIERHVIARQLAETGPTALAPLVEYMGAPDTLPQARLFVLQCVNDHLTTAYLPDLKPLLESTDEVTRAIGVMAIGHIKNETVVQLLTIARNDPSARVQFSALSGLVMQGDPAARQEFRQLYLTNATFGDIQVSDVKREIVRVLLRDAGTDDVPILQDAISQDFIAINARAMIAETLGRLGDESAIPLLEASLNLQKEPEYVEMVQQAIAAIHQRAGQA